MAGREGPCRTLINPDFSCRGPCITGDLCGGDYLGQYIDMPLRISAGDGDWRTEIQRPKWFGKKQIDRAVCVPVRSEKEQRSCSDMELMCTVRKKLFGPNRRMLGSSRVSDELSCSSEKGSQNQDGLNRARQWADAPGEKDGANSPRSSVFWRWVDKAPPRLCEETQHQGEEEADEIRLRERTWSIFWRVWVVAAHVRGSFHLRASRNVIPIKEEQPTLCPRSAAIFRARPVWVCDDGLVTFHPELVPSRCLVPSSPTCAPAIFHVPNQPIFSSSVILWRLRPG